MLLYRQRDARLPAQRRRQRLSSLVDEGQVLSRVGAVIVAADSANESRPPAKVQKRNKLHLCQDNQKAVDGLVADFATHPQWWKLPTLVASTPSMYGVMRSPSTVSARWTHASVSSPPDLASASFTTAGTLVRNCDAHW